MGNDIFSLGECNIKKSRSDRLWQVLPALLALSSAVVSTKLPNVTWLPYLCGLAVLIVILVVSNPAIQFVWKKFYLVPRDKQLLRKLNTDITEKLAEAKIASELCRKMGDLSWQNGRFPDCYRFENKYQNLLNFVRSNRTSIPQMVMFICYVLRSFLEDADQFLYLCDNSLQSGVATYKSEYQANEIRKQLGQYEAFLQNYTKMCERVNRQLKTLNIHGFYGHNLNFQWKKSLDAFSDTKPENGSVS